MSILDRPLKYKQIRMGRLGHWKSSEDGRSIETSNLRNVNFWDFSNLGLTKIPQEIIEYYQTVWPAEAVDALDFSHNNITGIPRELICTYIRHLDLSHNNIKELPSGIDLVRVQTLNLSSNMFRHIPTNAISNAHNLIDLNMDNNHITEILKSDEELLNNLDLFSLEDNPIKYGYAQKLISKIRIGVIDYKKMARSRFKFRFADYSTRDRFLYGIENSDLVHRRLQHLSDSRFHYYENIKAYGRHMKRLNKQKSMNQYPLDHNIFMDRLIDMVNTFKDVTMNNDGQYLELVLSDTSREKEFDEWLPKLFDGCLVD